MGSIHEIQHVELSSPAFQNGQPIPVKYSGDGEDISPPLQFNGIPSGTKSLAIVVEDPDAPGGTFYHWIVWNLPSNTSSLAEGAKVSNQGRNSFGDVSYRGPKPPSGQNHHYVFKIFALDSLLHLPPGATKRRLEAAMEGHILGQGELVGTFQR